MYALVLIKEQKLNMNCICFIIHEDDMKGEQERIFTRRSKFLTEHWMNSLKHAKEIISKRNIDC